MLKTRLGLPLVLREAFSRGIIHEKRFGLILDLFKFCTFGHSLHRALYTRLTSAFIPHTQKRNRRHEKIKGNEKKQRKCHFCPQPILNICTSEFWPKLGQTGTLLLTMKSPAGTAIKPDLRSVVTGLNPASSIRTDREN